MLNNKWNTFNNKNSKDKIKNKWLTVKKIDLISKNIDVEELKIAFDFPEVRKRFSEEDIKSIVLKGIAHCEVILNSGYCEGNEEFKNSLQNCQESLRIQRNYK